MADNSFDARAELEVGDRTFEIYRLDALQSKFDVARLPFSLKVLLENLLRNEDGVGVRARTSRRSPPGTTAPSRRRRSRSRPRAWCCRTSPACPASSTSPRCATRWPTSAATRRKINPLVPVELVIDHSVQVDVFGTRDAFRINAEKEFERNKERYAFLRWGQTAFEGFKVVPPDTGIVHQVNLEYLSRVVFTSDETAHDGPVQAYPDTLVGTDSHTTMINGLGVLGWGVGGIEAEAAMLGQPMSMLIPRVVGFKLHGDLPEGATATDLVLTVTQMLREHGVVSQVRRVLRPRRPEPAAGRPRDDRQHVAGVRLDLRDLPDRRRDAALPRVLRAPEGADRARRGLRARAGPVARRGLRGADLLRDAGARPRRGRAVAGRARSARRTASR